jgi:hypothetical protein
VTGWCIYVFGNGALSFDDFRALYVPAIETALERTETSWVVCDFRGVDTLTMEYLKTQTASVTVLHVGAAPRYLPDRRYTQVEKWTIRGGFADDDARDQAALASASHFLAVDRFSRPVRATATARLIDNARAAGCAPLVADPARAVALARARAQIDDAPVHPTARAFANLLLDLFPPWFDFAPEHLAILRWSLGLHLVVTGPGRCRDGPVAIITTSDSRQMSIAVHHSARVCGETAKISMHYSPSEVHRARARTNIGVALHALFPEQPIDPERAAIAAQVSAGKIFPG